MDEKGVDGLVRVYYGCLNAFTKRNIYQRTKRRFGREWDRAKRQLVMGLEAPEISWECLQFVSTDKFRVGIL